MMMFLPEKSNRIRKLVNCVHDILSFHTQFLPMPSIVLQGRSIAKNLNKILLQIIKKRCLRVQIGNNLFFNISDDFYMLKL